MSYTFTRRRLFSGFDGATCKASPRIATDGKTTFLLYHMIKLCGSDVCFGMDITRTDDGEHFTEPKRMAGLASVYRDGFRIQPDGNLLYSRRFGKWFGIGRTTYYQSDLHPVLLGEDKPSGGITVSGDPIFLTFDPETADFTSWEALDFPFPYLCATPFSFHELPSGELLIGFYYNTPDMPEFTRLQILRYDVSGDRPRAVGYGAPILNTEIERGLSEPEIVLFRGKYYMTIRSNENAFLAESEDGLNYSEPRLWRFDDGELLGSINTQQHWLKGGDGELYLTYTRKTPYNDHVIRNRAPIFITRYDADRDCLIRAEEVPLVPELGARLGNFRIVHLSESEKWLVVCEWMQPIGCEKYGSDNSLWLVKLRF